MKICMCDIKNHWREPEVGGIGILKVLSSNSVPQINNKQVKEKVKKRVTGNLN